MNDDLPKAAGQVADMVTAAINFVDWIAEDAVGVESLIFRFEEGQVLKI